MSNSEILREFLLETHENLALLDADLLRLEQRPQEKDTLAQVFRTLHSVKGTAGFLGFAKLQKITHAAENLLSRLRAGEILFNPPIATALLQAVDAVRELLSQIEATSEEGAGDYSSLIAQLERLRETGGLDVAVAAPPSAIPTPQVAAPNDSATVPPAAPLPPFVPTSPAAVPSTGPAPASIQVAPAAPAPVTVAPAPLATVGSAGAHPSQDESPGAFAGSTVGSSLGGETAVIDPLEPKSSGVVDAAIRVDVGLLDKLMTLVGELVLARNQLLQQSGVSEDGGLLGAVQRLNRLTTELQASVMKTRMQPIGNLLNKFPRVVRDLALMCQKKIRFEMDGHDTELDRTLIEAIRDPLTHMVRNAIDHGIESPQVRAAQGKPEEGRLRLVAFHEGGKVVIEISDDGAGIDVNRVRDKALDSKLISPEAVARMSRGELLRLVFLPGISTARQVTQLSGRGVGLDVVRTNIEKIGGSVDIESTPGVGTTIRTKVPLTLAIIPALVIECGAERYAIPQASLLELVRLTSTQATQAIERIQGAPVYRLRDRLLPLVFLDEQLRLETRRDSQDDLQIVVLQADEHVFGLVVDGIRDTEEIVVKPLQKQLKSVPVFAGATIMGDGRVALVMDVLGLAQRAGVLSVSKSRMCEGKDPASNGEREAEPVLLFTSRTGGQLAVPLSEVARIEKFRRSQLEDLGGRYVVQYRGELLPLVDLTHAMRQLRRDGGGASEPRYGAAEGAATSDDTVSVVVYAAGDLRVGLMVGQILDVVREPITTMSAAIGPGARFTAVVQDRVTEFLDVAAILRTTPRASGPVPQESLAGSPKPP